MQIGGVKKQAQKMFVFGSDPVSELAGLWIWRIKRPIVVAVLALWDVVVLQTCLFLGLVIRNGLMGLFSKGPLSFEYCSVISLALCGFPLGYLFFGLYPGYGMGVVERLRQRVRSTFVLFSVMVLTVWIFKETAWSRGVILSAAVCGLMIVPLAEVILRKCLIRLGLWGEPVVILGAARTGTVVVQSLNQQMTLGFVPVAFLDDDPEKWGLEINGVRVIGPLHLASVLAQKGVKIAIVAMPGMERRRLTKLCEKLNFERVIIIPDLFGFQSLWVLGRDLGGVLGLEVRKNLLRTHNRIMKRAVDIILGSFFFLISVPIIGVLAFLVKLVDGGPAFYSQQREGYGGRLIRIWKLRTMYPDAEKRLEEYLAANPEARSEWERFFKLKNDPRVLPCIGSFLRKTSLDELPQLWNVVKGDLSLVGPRPFPTYHLEKFSEEFRELRRSVWPGITGLWQVLARSDGDVQVQEFLDTYYIRNWSPWLDIYILSKTFWVLVRGKGAY